MQLDRLPNEYLSGVYVGRGATYGASNQWRIVQTRSSGSTINAIPVYHRIPTNLPIDQALD